MADNIVKITLKIGEATVEIEGPESYVEKKLKETNTFDSLITQFSGLAKPLPQQKRRKRAKGEKPRKPSRQGYEIVKDLVLKEDGDKISLKEFYSQKNPRSNYERNAVFCYYLIKIKEVKPIGINHIYTCYKEVKQKVGDIVVSLSETSGKGWLDTSNMNDIKLSLRGENLVEYDLPKTKKVK
jgi:hypothetical protein